MGNNHVYRSEQLQPHFQLPSHKPNLDVPNLFDTQLVSISPVRLFAAIDSRNTGNVVDNRHTPGPDMHWRKDAAGSYNSDMGLHFPVQYLT